MDDRPRGRSAAQWFCLIVGGTLVVVGLLGFLAEATFDTSAGSDPGAVDGENFILFEVNGWHNVVHILSGVFLLALSGKHRTARTAALAFGGIYAVVTVIGLIDGHDVLGVLPVNPADNVLHILLTVTALAVGLVSDRDRRDVRTTPESRRFEREAPGATAQSPTPQRR
ncbi:MAG TPA: DUF4383 domain-containing protein [Thermoleophilaceae bacterium]|nr:DUF4383 domain-containing protein [Thermoleophilaceae bacterium]